MKTNWQLRMALGVLALLLATPTAWAQRHLGRKLTAATGVEQAVATKKATLAERVGTDASVYDAPGVTQAIAAGKARSAWMATLIPTKQPDSIFTADPKEAGTSLVPAHLSFVSDVAIRSEGSALLLTVLDPATRR